MSSKNKGWFGESLRHRLASLGYKTTVPDSPEKRKDIVFQKKDMTSKGKSKDDEEDDDRFWLEREAKIYIPSTDDTKRQISDERFEKRIKEAQQEFTKEFGGSTTFLGEGTYISDAGDFVKEDIAVMQVNMSKDDWNQEKENIYEWLEEKQKEWGQESLSFELEGNLTFIE